MTAEPIPRLMDSGTSQVAESRRPGPRELTASERPGAREHRFNWELVFGVLLSVAFWSAVILGVRLLV